MSTLYLYKCRWEQSGKTREMIAEKRLKTYNIPAPMYADDTVQQAIHLAIQLANQHTIDCCGGFIKDGKFKRAFWTVCQGKNIVLKRIVGGYPVTTTYRLEDEA